MSQAEIARRTGVGRSYLSEIRNVESKSNRGMGAHIVRLVSKGLHISPDYFFDEYEGERDHRQYNLDEYRGERRFRAIEAAQLEQSRQLAELTKQLASMGELRAENLALRQENAELKRTLAKAGPRRR